jgi:phenylacetate-coenzyme A ligase PaaK-like adenylate-forming protein
MDTKRWVYDHSPLWMQDFMCTVAGRKRNKQRYDALFEQRRKFFTEAAQWSLPKVRAYQLEKLKELARRAYEKVPFYRSWFDDAAVRPDDIQDLADWIRIPTLTKDIVKEAGESLIASDVNPKELIRTHSGGSTGMPLPCYHDANAIADVYASFWAYQRRESLPPTATPPFRDCR